MLRYMHLLCRNVFSLCNRDVLRVLVSAGLYDDPPPDAVPPPPRADVIEYTFFEKWRAENPHLIPVRAEMNIWADDLLLAGQLDMLVYDTDKKVLAIYDWKRSKSMDRMAFNDRRGKAPLGDLPDTNFGCVFIESLIQI